MEQERAWPHFLHIFGLNFSFNSLKKTIQQQMIWKLIAS